MQADHQGVSHGRYNLIPRTLVFLKFEEEVLLLRGAPDKKRYANQLNGIGGHIEQSEDVFSSAMREIQEEAGIVPSPLHLCGTIIIDTGFTPGIGLYVFTGQVTDKQTQPSKEGSLEWHQLADLENASLVEDLPTLLPRVISWNPGDPLFHALYQYGDDGELVIQFAGQ